MPQLERWGLQIIKQVNIKGSNMSTNSAKMTQTKSVAFIGISVALLAVSAWFTIPIGPVPVTLQVFVYIFLIMALPKKEAIAAIALYVAIGTAGLPVFSSMRGGISVVAGPTGGFLWGAILAAVAAVLVISLLQKFTKAKSDNAQTANLLPDTWVYFVASFVFLAVLYLSGWAQLMYVAHMDAASAFAAGVAPFVLIDSVKIIAAVFVATGFKKAFKGK